MKILCIVQARMGSTRLPGKVLRDLAGEPMLARVFSRLRRSETLSDIVVATTTSPRDGQVESCCKARGWKCFRGSESDVLDRYHRAARAHPSDVIVRVTADCPLIEPEVVDLVVREFLAQLPRADYVSNVVPYRTFPHGLDTEVFSAAALERAWLEDADPEWREHVTPYLYRRPDLFRTHCVTHHEDLSSYRWTVDTQADWELMSRIYGHFGHDGFGWRETMDLLRKNPEWSGLNRHVEQRTVR